jgi:uncharacterized protein with HEPN domain
MLANEQNDLLHLLNILESIGKIWHYTEDVDNVETFYELNDQLNVNGCLNLLTNIGESIAKISNGLKSEYPQIPWRLFQDFRNKIVHNYIGIDLAIVYEVIKVDLVSIKNNIEVVITEKLAAHVFDPAEIAVSKESDYYKYIDWKKIDKNATSPATATAKQP